MLEEPHIKLLNRLNETFPTSNKRMMSSFYLNILLVLNEARPSYRIDVSPPESKTRYDFIDIVFDIYPDKFEIFEYKTPHIFLKSNKVLINSILETMTHENFGKSLGYCYTNKDALDCKLMRVGLSIMAYSKINKIKTQLYATCVPTSELNENIMNILHNDIINYNKILNKYDYIVYLKTDLLWLDNENMVRNCKYIPNPNKIIK